MSKQDDEFMTFDEAVRQTADVFKISLDAARQMLRDAIRTGELSAYIDASDDTVH